MSLSSSEAKTLVFGSRFLDHSLFSFFFFHIYSFLNNNNNLFIFYSHGTVEESIFLAILKDMVRALCVL